MCIRRLLESIRNVKFLNILIIVTEREFNFDDSLVGFEQFEVILSGKRVGRFFII